MKVFVYFNLHKHVFSVKALEGEMKGRVIAHRAALNLTDAVFKVSEAGRQRVLREKRKNVHAGVVGQWIDVDHPLQQGGRAVTYNPYKYSTFIDRASEQPVAAASWAFLKDRSIVAGI